jgi:transposase-like protein
MSQEGKSQPGSSPGARRAVGDGPGQPAKAPVFSFKQKAAIVLRLLRGEDLELLSRELGVTAAQLSQWREKFLQAGQAGLKKEPKDNKDAEISKLKEKLGEVTMECELLHQKVDRLETGRPLRWRRSRK